MCANQSLDDGRFRRDVNVLEVVEMTQQRENVIVVQVVMEEGERSDMPCASPGQGSSDRRDGVVLLVIHVDRHCRHALARFNRHGTGRRDQRPGKHVASSKHARNVETDIELTERMRHASLLRVRDYECQRHVHSGS